MHVGVERTREQARRKLGFTRLNRTDLRGDAYREQADQVALRQR
jgi:hypothetical protein